MNVYVNGAEERIPSPLSVSDFLKEKEIVSRNVVVEYNGVILKSDEYGSTSLKESDRLEILRILGGG